MTTNDMQDRAIPKGSLILVTGGNGLIASHVIDQLMNFGYHVRTTVRNPAKCAWIEPLYSKRHGPGKLELVHVSDFSSPDKWAAAVKGVAAIAHVAAASDLGTQDFQSSLKVELPMHINLLEAAIREDSVKSFAFTTSAWASFTPDPSKKRKLTEWSWNEDAIELASSDASPQEKGFSNFMALRTRIEQEVWKWVKERKPHFAFNTILPDTVMGECLDPVNQGVPSTAGMVHWVWTGDNRDILANVKPQWHVDTGDIGLLYVAALTTHGVNGERLFGSGERYSWYQVREILCKLYPDKDILPVEDLGKDQTEVPTQRADELLRRLGRNRWTSLEESVKANALSIMQLPQEQ